MAAPATTGMASRDDAKPDAYAWLVFAIIASRHLVRGLTMGAVK